MHPPQLYIKAKHLALILKHLQYWKGLHAWLTRGPVEGCQLRNRSLSGDILLLAMWEWSHSGLDGTVLRDMTHVVAVVTTYVRVALRTIASKMVCVSTPGNQKCVSIVASETAIQGQAHTPHTRARYTTLHSKHSRAVSDVDCFTQWRIFNHLQPTWHSVGKTM